MSWVKINTINKFPSAEGLYAIYDKRNNELLYLGRAINLHNRFSNYAGKVGFSLIKATINTGSLYFKYKVTNELWMEKLLIHRLQPKYNHKRNTEKRYVSDAELLKSIIRS